MEVAVDDNTRRGQGHRRASVRAGPQVLKEQVRGAIRKVLVNHVPLAGGGLAPKVVVVLRGVEVPRGVRREGAGAGRRDGKSKKLLKLTF